MRLCRPAMMGALSALFGLQACATRNEMRNAPSDAGLGRTYAFSFEKVRLASQDALGELSFNIKEKDSHLITESCYQFLAGQGLASGTSGRWARIRVEDQKSQCVVYVLVRSKVDSREAEPVDNAIAEDLHKRIAARLK